MTVNNIDAYRGLTLAVSVEVWQKLQTYVQLCHTEINGFGVIQRLNPHVFLLEDVFIFEQEASDVHVTVSSEVMHRRLYQLDQAGMKLSTIRFQWHSHVNMAAYMSDVDEANIDAYPGDWMISLVANKRGEFEARLDVMKPLRLTLAMAVEVVIGPSDSFSDVIRAEIAEKVKTTDGGLFHGGRRFFGEKDAQPIVVERFAPSPEMGVLQ